MTAFVAARGRSAVELAQAALAAAAENRVNAVAAVDPERVLADAARLDAAPVPVGPLHGVPVTVKDLFAVEGLPMRGGTRARLPDPGPEGTAVRRLRAAGALIVGIANCHEIALGLTGENPWTGDVLNPVDPSRQAGGSSSGSAAGVATGFGLVSLGTDTGGSLRVPASNCGVVGFKPSRGLVPLDGCLPLSPSFDHAGPIARTVADARLLTEVLAGRPLPAREVDEPRIGVPAGFVEASVDAQVAGLFEHGMAFLAPDAELVEVDLPFAAGLIDDYTTVVRHEAARVHAEALATGGEGFSPTVRASLLSGAAIEPAAHRAALARVAAMEAALRDLLAGLDALLLPAVPALPLRRGEGEVMLDGRRVPHRTAQLALTAPFSMAGVPAACVPFGRGGLPFGVQLVGLDDARTLDVAAWVEARVP